MKIFYFTTTGNSLAVARAIGGELFPIMEVLASGLEEWSDSEAIGVVCPVYFGKLPRPVWEFLSSAVLIAPYKFLVLTCGNTPAFAVCNDDVDWDYVASVRMVDNYFPMFDVARQIRDLPSKRVDENVSRVRGDIASRRVARESLTFYGRIAGWYMKMFPLSKKAYRNFYIDALKCTGCGVCERLCPVSNIVMSGGRPMIEAGCMTCGACYHNCPSAAIRYKGEKSMVQYRHDGILLADILRQRSG
ncbi:MAG: 4Fe-4S binding protein [Bacteroides sp.]|nr:4Fe-4S binding protein [Bacteroides sp.]